MAVAKNRADWLRTASILAMLLNVNRDPKKKRLVEPHELMPPGLVEKRTTKQEPDFYVTPSAFAQMIQGKEVETCPQ